MTTNAAASAADGDADQRSTAYRPVDHPAVTRPMESTRTTRSDASALAELQLHWGGAYEIGLDGDIWSATFRGTADELRAHASIELRALIRADYAYRQQAGPSGGLPPPDSRNERSQDKPATRPGLPGSPDVIRGERMSL